MLVLERIPHVPPTITPREDVGTQVADALISLATAPKGGAFSCKYLPGECCVHWGYVWREPDGCRSALTGWIEMNTRTWPMREVEVPEADRWGIGECYQDFERRVDSAWMPVNYGRWNPNQDIFKEA